MADDVQTTPAVDETQTTPVDQTPPATPETPVVPEQESAEAQETKEDEVTEPQGALPTDLPPAVPPASDDDAKFDFKNEEEDHVQPHVAEGPETARPAPEEEAELDSVETANKASNEAMNGDGPVGATLLPPAGTQGATKDYMGRPLNGVPAKESN